MEGQQLVFYFGLRNLELKIENAIWATLLVSVTERGTAEEHDGGYSNI